MDQLVFSKNTLSKIASDEGYPYIPGTRITLVDGEQQQISPNWNKGQLYFAIKDDANTTNAIINGQTVQLGHHKAYIYLDDDSSQKRYYVTSPIDWSDILNKPLDNILTKLSMVSNVSHNLQLHSLDGTINTTELPFVLLSGDTMTGPLGIAASATAGAPKVQLLYNSATESLDFTFT